jgi:hypothetical protein
MSKLQTSGLVLKQNEFVSENAHTDVHYSIGDESVAIRKRILAKNGSSKSETIGFPFDSTGYIFN